jgi:hypothetical protein
MAALSTEWLSGLALILPVAVLVWCGVFKRLTESSPEQDRSQVPRAPGMDPPTCEAMHPPAQDRSGKSAVPTA